MLPLKDKVGFLYADDDTAITGLVQVTFGQETKPLLQHKKTDDKLHKPNTPPTRACHIKLCFHHLDIKITLPY